MDPLADLRKKVIYLQDAFDLVQSDFNLFDSDGDGEISFEELKAQVQQRGTSPRSTSRNSIDLRAQYALHNAGAQGIEVLHQLFREADVNNNETVDLYHFIEIFQYIFV
jgi:Ca2+-binding EF-hand superfamily protein